jgi:Fe-Mn family superoxide dismutase
MAHSAKNFDSLIGNTPGLSEPQLRAHFELYQGYVNKLNEIEEQLKTADHSKANYSYDPISELRRRHAVAFNGAYLHEYYFENLTGKTTQPAPDLEAALNERFGSMVGWLDQALAGLKSADGWVLLTRSRIDDTLQCCVLEEHHRGLFVEQDILLAIDGWEHAYLVDYGIKKADYFKAILGSLNWGIASRRYQQSRQALARAA